MPFQMIKPNATFVGLVAVVLWSLLALFTAASGNVPPFQLTAICFSIATLIGIIGVMKTGKGFSALKLPLPVWLLGVSGLFGYHFFYFTALRLAPPVEAGLIAYLWPLLIILFSALMPGEKLKTHHVIGGLIGLGGAFLIVSKGGSFSFKSEFAMGYVAAAICALIWSGYSVLSRRFSDIPSTAVTGFCAATAFLSFIAHIFLETTHWPQSTTQWLAVIGLGLGPVGLAFYVWDYGVKKGNIQLLGAASYAAPVLSTFALIGAGYSSFTWNIGLATLLVTLGAVVAARDLIWKN